MPIAMHMLNILWLIILFKAVIATVFPYLHITIGAEDDVQTAAAHRFTAAANLRVTPVPDE